MSKEAKYITYFLGFLCLLIFVTGLMTSCESKGVQAKEVSPEVNEVMKAFPEGVKVI